MPLFVYGPTGGGKSGVLSDVLASLDVPRAIVDCVACATHNPAGYRDSRMLGTL